MIKRQFGYVKNRFRGLAKNTVQLTTLFALSNPLDGAPVIIGWCRRGAPYAYAS